MSYIELKNIGFLFLQSVYNSLGISQLLNQIKSDSKIEYDLNGLTKLLVFGRILNPQSKKKTFEERDKYLFSIVSSNEIKEVYRTLDVLDKNSKKILTIKDADYMSYIYYIEVVIKRFGSN